MIKDGKILLLENVSVDRNLPKYKDTNTANSVNIMIGSPVTS